MKLFGGAGRALGLAAAFCWLAPAPPCASAPWPSAAGPCLAQMHIQKSDKGDLRERFRESLPVALKGGALVLVATAVIMVLLLGLVDLLRKILRQDVSLNRRSAFPSGRRHYVKVGALGVPSEFEWQFPVLVVGGDRLNMRMAHKVKGAKDTWEMEGGTRLEFVPKADVDSEREKREMELRATRDATHAWRRFDESDDDSAPGPR